MLFHRQKERSLKIISIKIRSISGERAQHCVSLQQILPEAKVECQDLQDMCCFQCILFLFSREHCMLQISLRLSLKNGRESLLLRLEQHVVVLRGRSTLLH